ncbi:unnamed protein product [Schistocephalus solidus]|uniref:Uncharacterized protein n=1 Tax=Schistocephalus solidus TaxID=70667 RepID=A0A183TMF2_SCHSO|nr:unnamed protein product [Schistocephalus solidus]
MNRFTATCDNFVHTINTTKMVVMPPTATHHRLRCINVNDTELQAIDTFTYLSSNLSRSSKIDAEVTLWIFKAS